jgi:hypothetical protein
VVWCGPVGRLAKTWWARRLLSLVGAALLWAGFRPTIPAAVRRPGERLRLQLRSQWFEAISDGPGHLNIPGCLTAGWSRSHLAQPTEGQARPGSSGNWLCDRSRIVTSGSVALKRAGAICWAASTSAPRQAGRVLRPSSWRGYQRSRSGSMPPYGVLQTRAFRFPGGDLGVPGISISVPQRLQLCERAVHAGDSAQNSWPGQGGISRGWTGFTPAVAPVPASCFLGHGRI